MAVRIVLGGDVNLNRADPAAALRPLLPVLAAADVRFVNLEGPLCPPSADPAHPDIPHKRGWRHSPPEQVAGLTAAGIDAVGCANNVTYPGAAALASLATLDAHGIAHCGAGADLVAARAPAIVGRVGFLAYTSIVYPYGHAATTDSPGVAPLRADTYYRPDPRVAEVPGRPPVVHTVADPGDLAAMRVDITRLRERVDVVVLSVHWGVPGDTICAYQREIAHAAVDAGADIVAGHGAHEVHGVELHRGRPILYGLGNAAFDWPRMRGRGGGILAAVDTGSGDVRLHPVSPADERGDVRLLDVAGPLADRVSALSARLGTPVGRDGDALVVAAA